MICKDCLSPLSNQRGIWANSNGKPNCYASDGLQQPHQAVPNPVESHPSAVEEVQRPELCMYCLGDPDHKHANGKPCCGGCCFMHGRLAEIDPAMYEWVRDCFKAQAALLAEKDAEIARLDHLLRGQRETNGDTNLHLAQAQAELKAEKDLREKAEAERDRLCGLINTPSTADFLDSVRLEAAHQRERWPAVGDAGKTMADWFWLVGYLAGKAIRPFQTEEKTLHHIITTAAVCLNWHRHVTGEATEMRPGIATPDALPSPPCTESAPETYEQRKDRIIASLENES